MGLHSLRILAQAGFSGVLFAAKILRRELPRYRLPLAEFAANVIPCSAPLNLVQKVSFKEICVTSRLGQEQTLRYYFCPKLQ